MTEIINVLKDELKYDGRITSEESHSSLNAEEWITTAHKNTNANIQKQHKHIRGEATSPGVYISTKNRFSTLSNLKGDECASLQSATKPMEH
jgi:hypothetical protein